MSDTVLTPEELQIIRSRTSEDCAKIAKADCCKCIYASGVTSYSGRNPNYSRITCDYLFFKGHRRPCLAGYCRENGVFKKRTRGKRKSSGDFTKDLEEAENAI